MAVRDWPRSLRVLARARIGKVNWQLIDAYWRPSFDLPNGPSRLPTAGGW